jgi:hypothetical protein
MVTQDETGHADVELAIPVCPYCSQPLEGQAINGLHPDCARKLSEELDEIDRTRGITHIKE